MAAQSVYRPHSAVRRVLGRPRTPVELRSWSPRARGPSLFYTAVIGRSTAPIGRVHLAAIALLCAACGPVPTVDVFATCTSLSSPDGRSAKVCSNTDEFWGQITDSVLVTERAYNDYYSKDLDLWRVLAREPLGIGVVEDGLFDDDGGKAGGLYYMGQSSIEVLNDDYVFWPIRLGHELLHMVQERVLDITELTHRRPQMMFNKAHPDSVTCEWVMQDYYFEVYKEDSR